MSPNQSPKRRLTASDRVWRFLCLLVIMSGLVVFTPVWSVLPTVIQGVAAVPGVLVTLLIVVASFASSTGSSMSRDGSTARFGSPDER